MTLVPHRSRRRESRRLTFRRCLRHVLLASGLALAAGPTGAGTQSATPPGTRNGRAASHAQEMARRMVALLRQVEYVAIPPGEFLMGCPPTEAECGRDEVPAHRVSITKGFEIARHEVTQAVWQAVTGTNPSTYKGADRPVEQVSWDDVQEFLAVLNGLRDGYRYRLPTEAEWEYAARAGSTGPYYAPLDDIAWYSGNSDGQTHPVGQKKPNAWGLEDMQGNVWEWCQDWYAEDCYRNFAGKLAVDPQGPDTGEYRVLRGGSWYKFLWFLRASSRFGFRPSGRYPHIGFRCVREKG